MATGHLNEPRHVDEFRTGFGGEYLHSNDYRVADSFVGNTRVRRGYRRNSGVDVASDVCSVASRTVLVARSGVRIQPKMVLGIAYPGLAIGLRKPWVPACSIGCWRPWCTWPTATRLVSDSGRQKIPIASDVFGIDHCPH